MTLRDEQLQRLSGYLDGELDEQQTQTLETELAANDELAAELERLRGVRELVRALPPHKAPDDFVQRIMDRVERGQLMGRATRKDNAPSLRWLGYLATAAVLVLAISAGFIVYRTLQTETFEDLIVRQDRPHLEDSLRAPQPTENGRHSDITDDAPTDTDNGMVLAVAGDEQETTDMGVGSTREAGIVEGAVVTGGVTSDTSTSLASGRMEESALPPTTTRGGGGEPVYFGMAEPREMHRGLAEPGAAGSAPACPEAMARAEIAEETGAGEDGIFDAEAVFPQAEEETIYADDLSVARQQVERVLGHNRIEVVREDWPTRARNYRLTEQALNVANVAQVNRNTPEQTQYVAFVPNDRLEDVQRGLDEVRLQNAGEPQDWPRGIPQRGSRTDIATDLSESVDAGRPQQRRRPELRGGFSYTYDPFLGFAFEPVWDGYARGGDSTVLSQSELRMMVPSEDLTALRDRSNETTTYTQMGMADLREQRTLRRHASSYEGNEDLRQRMVLNESLVDNLSRASVTPLLITVNLRHARTGMEDAMQAGEAVPETQPGQPEPSQPQTHGAQE